MTYYLRKEWKLNTIAGLFLIAVSICEALTSIAMMHIFENIINFHLAGFFQWVVLDSIIFVFLLAFDQLSTIWKGRAICSMNNRVRLDIAASLARSDYQEFHAQESGAYLSQFTNNISQIESLAWDTFFQCITAAASVAASIFALLMLHWSLAVASILASFILLNAPKLFGKKMEALGAACSEEQAAGTGKMKDLLSGFDVLRAFGQQKRFLEGIKEASSQVEKSKYHLSWAKNLARDSITLVSLIVQMLINCLIGFLSIKGFILQGALMGGGNLCGSVSNGLANLGTIQLSISAAKPYFDAITVHAEDAVPQETPEYEPICGAISMKNISFSYGEKQVLDNQSFLFEEGGKYALIGPSGCGKSTVLKLLLGWMPDYEGEICFGNANIRSLSQEQLMSQISYIAQEVFLFNSTIRDNITLGCEFPDEMLKKAIQCSALNQDLINMPLGLDTPVGEDGSSLSGGQKQRIAIARALIHNRSILLIDEGTSALDRKNADIVEKSLLDNPDLTLILVSHHLSDERKRQFTHIYELKPIESGLNRI